MPQNARSNVEKRIKTYHTLASKVKKWNGICNVSNLLIICIELYQIIRFHSLGVEDVKALMIYGLQESLIPLRSHALK